MKHTSLRIALFLLEAGMVVLSLIGVLALFSGAQTPLNTVYLSTFTGTTIVLVGLLMVGGAILLGSSSLLGAATIFIHREAALRFSTAAGFIIADYQLVMAVILFQFSWLQAFYLVTGLLIFGLAAYLQMTEYHGWEIKRYGYRLYVHHMHPAA